MKQFNLIDVVVLIEHGPLAEGSAMLYHSPDEAASDIARKGWCDRTNTGENRAIDPKHSAYKNLACNGLDRPVLLESVMARVVVVGILIVIASIIAIAVFMVL